MKHLLTAALALSFALPIEAQPAADANPDSRPVAVINGQTITAAQLDALWGTISPARREQYEVNGGKALFLNNYINKRLLVQEALKKGFDKKPDVQADMEAAKESVLFDRYVRDVVAGSLITDAEVRQYYDDHKAEFATPEQLKVRHIVIVPNGAGPKPKSKDEAFDLAKQVSMELAAQTVHAQDPASIHLRQRAFEAAAQKYSEDASAGSGGDLGWVGKGMLDPQFEAAAWALPVGAISGIVETKFGYHLIFVEAKRPAGTEPFENAAAKIREAITQARASEIMESVTKLTNDLRNTSKISVFPENIR